MLTQADIARMLTSGLKTTFQDGYKGVETIFQDLTTEVKSNKASEEYGWLGETSGLKEWIDERTPKALRENGFTLKNKDYEDSITVDRNALEDDQYGQITTRINGMGVAAKKSYDVIFTEVVEAGHTSVCYDGQNFFDTDHEEGDSGTQSNYSASGMALSETNLETIIGTMSSYKTDAGKLAGINPTHIMVPGNLEFTAKKILDPSAVGATVSTTPNAVKGRLNIIVNRYLSQTGGASAAYYVLDLSGAVKPFIYQNRKELEFAAQDNPDSPDFFMRKKLHY